MYQIKCDDYVLHDPAIDELKVIGAKCSLELNKTGSLTFQIHPTHPYYDVIKKHTSQVTLLQDGEVLFCGRVLNDGLTIDNIKSIECEGVLSYLIDSVQRPKTYTLDNGTNTIEKCLKTLIENHNSQVDDYKKFKLGNVTVTYDDDIKTTISSDYENTLSFINNKLISSYGGYLIIRNEVDGRYIDYITEYTNACNQLIQFGKNIVDMKTTLKGENIYTAIIGVGNKTEKGSLPSLRDYADGTYEGMIKSSDYIYNPEGVEKYGWIWKYIHYDTYSSYWVLQKAIADLKNSVNTEITLDLTAVDLHLVNVNIDRISIGDMIRCISEPHDFDMTMLVSAVTIDIDNAANTKVKLVLPTQARTNLGDNLTKKINDNKKSTEKDIVDNLDQKLTDNNDTLKQWVSDNFTPLTTSDGGTVDLSDYAKNADVDTKINDLKDWTDNNYVPRNSTSDLSAYAKIVDVNTAFDELATALEGV